jgi:hypothetical protein
MVLEIIHLIILTATLTCGLVVAWYAQKIHSAQARELSFLDARDVDQRRHRAEARHAGQAWNKEIGNWHRDTRAILGKLYAIAAETSAEERDTRLMPPPTQPPSVMSSAGSAASTAAPDTSPQPGVAPVSRQRPSPRDSTPTAYRAVAPPASAALLTSAPALVAAGIGPRPPASTLVSTRRPPPITVADPPVVTPRAEPSRRATVMGLQPHDEGASPHDRVSWEALKQPRGLGGSTQPAKVEARFPGTMLSMPSTVAPGSAPPSRRSRPIAPVETKSICRECDGGFVAVGHGGIGKCRDCDGSGFIDAR